MDDLFTWYFLSTAPGAAIATGLITQCLKRVLQEKLPWLRTQMLSYFIALLVYGSATWFSGGVKELPDLLLIPLNALVVSLSSNGAYAAVQREQTKKAEGKKAEGKSAKEAP